MIIWRSSVCKIALLFLLMCLPVHCLALTSYYIDPDYTGGTRTGNAATPCQSLTNTVTNTPWTVINTALASDDVTVYWSARNASVDTAQLNTVVVNINRTDSSTHRLTLDGMSFYNTSDSSPSWV